MRNQGDRGSLIAYLTSREAPRLPRVDGKTAAAKGAGFVRANVEDGQVVLVPKGQKLDAGVRLLWGKGEKGAKRPVAPGDYQVRGYSVVRRDAKGVEWRTWTSGQGREVAVQAGAEMPLELDLDVTLNAKSFTMNGRPAVGGNFVGDRGMGLTLFRDRSRITVGWKAIRGGREVAGGACSFG